LCLHIEDVVHDNDIMSSNILFLQETHMHHPNSRKLFEHFICYSMYRVHGIMPLTKKNLIVSRTIQHATTNVQSMTMTITLIDNLVIICNLYIRPNAPVTKIITITSQVFSCLDTHRTLDIVGDFNIYMSTQNNNRKQLIEHIQNHNMQFLIDESQSLSQPIIDHVWSNEPALG